MRPSSDPAGLLHRIPELELFCDNDGVRRAIERGDPFAVYRALAWGRLFSRFAPQHAETLSRLLGNRRLFVKPLNGAPALFRLNGCGAGVYGETELGEDGWYIKTYCFCLIFVPLFPISQYLVRDAGNGWQFAGKVPLGPIAWAWNRLVVFGVLALVLGGAASAIDASLHARVYVVSGLEQTVRVRIGAEEVTVSPALASGGVPVSVVVPTGTHAVETRAEDGRVIETGTLEARAGVDAIVWNVLGAAPVYEEDVVYSAYAGLGDDVGPEPRVHCGEQLIEVDGVEDVFTEPPASVSMDSRTSRVTRQHVDVVEGGLVTCLAWLYDHGSTDRALELTQRLAAAGVDQAGLAEVGMAMAMGATDPNVAIEATRAARDRAPEDLDAHRAYQNAMTRGGRRAEVLAEYEARLAASPGSADAEYLLLRLLPRPDAVARATALFAREPSYAPVLRILAHAHYQTQELEEAAARFAQLEALDPTHAHEMVDWHARALVGLGRQAEALALVERAFADAPAGLRLGLGVLHARIAEPSLGGGRDPLLDSALAEVQGASGAWLRVTGHLRIEPAELEQVPAQQQLAATIIRTAAEDPQSALRACAEASEDELRALDVETWALLYAEACRVDPMGDAATQLASASFWGTPMADAIREYVQAGSSNQELEELPLEELAGVWLARSRVSSLSEAERTELRARAARADTLGDSVARAATTWPQI